MKKTFPQPLKISKSYVPDNIRMPKAKIRHHWIGRGKRDLWISEICNFSQVGYFQALDDHKVKTTWHYRLI